MKKFLTELFSDKSHINAKVVVGVIAFVGMLIYSIADVVSGVMGISMVIEKVVYEGLQYTAWVCLGIGATENIMGNKNLKNTDNE